MTGTVRVNAPVTSTYGLRITLTKDKTFLAGKAVEGPEDDVSFASVDSNYTVTTTENGFRIVDLTTNEVLAEGETYEALRSNALERGLVDIAAVTYIHPVE